MKTRILNIPKLLLITLALSNSGCVDFNSIRFNGVEYDSRGFNSAGFNREGFNSDGFNHAGFDREGYHTSGFNRDGFNRDGFDSNGFSSNGLFNGAGIHKATRTQFNDSGYDKDGYNLDGFNSRGTHRDTETEYDQFGFNTRGFNSDGFHFETGYQVDLNGKKDNGEEVKGHEINLRSLTGKGRSRYFLAATSKELKYYLQGTKYVGQYNKSWAEILCKNNALGPVLYAVTEFVYENLAEQDFYIPVLENSHSDGSSGPVGIDLDREEFNPLVRIGVNRITPQFKDFSRDDMLDGITGFSRVNLTLPHVVFKKIVCQ